MNTKLYLTCSSFLRELFKKYVYQIVLSLLKRDVVYYVLPESEDEVEEEQEERQPSPEPVQENANSGYYEAHPVT